MTAMLTWRQPTRLWATLAWLTAGPLHPFGFGAPLRLGLSLEGSDLATPALALTLIVSAPASVAIAIAMVWLAQTPRITHVRLSMITMLSCMITAALYAFGFATFALVRNFGLEAADSMMLMAVFVYAFAAGGFVYSTVIWLPTAFVSIVLLRFIAFRYTPDQPEEGDARRRYPQRA
ncbi:MAG: hypothetical protein AAGC72_17815 [Planctomycetota bacterium]